MPHDLPVLTVADADAWARWLDDHAGQSDGVWLTLAKKRVTHPTELSYEEALAEALCHGWVDGQLARNDERTFRRKFTPRQPRSRWSKRNVDIAEQLIANGRMRPAGLAAVSRARENGTWESAYEAQSKMEVPPDLASALKADPAANAMFARLNAANRYSILHRVTTAKRPDTRLRRIEQFVSMLSRGQTIHPQR
jgi:uncharacterized protein YdeI (YjbR/CyaY-like superfamily)